MTSGAKGLATVAGGFVLGGAITNLIGGVGRLATAGIDFGAEMANVNSILQLSDEGIQQLSDQVIALSSDPRILAGPAELAAGLYNISSSGFTGAEGLQVLEAASLAATAGMTSTDVAARGITAALNAYGLSAEDAGYVSDVLFGVVDKGVITFEQLANNLGNTLPIANSLGIGIDELGSAYALMTLKGVQASQAETQIASLMRSTLNPTQALTDAVQAQGYASAEAAIQAEGFGGFMKILGEASGGSKEKLFDMLGTQEAVNAALILGAENGEDFAAMLEEIQAGTEGVGATNKALEKQMKSSRFAIQEARKQVEILATLFIGALSPAISAVAKGFSSLLSGSVIPFAQSISNLISQGMNPLEATFMAVSRAIASIGGENTPGPLAALARGFRDLATLAAGLGAALADVVDAFQDLIQGDVSGFFDELQEAANTAFTAISQFAGIALDWVLDTGIPTVIGWVATYADDVWSGLKSAAGWGAEVLGNLLDWTLDVAAPSVQGWFDDIESWLNEKVNAGLDYLITLTNVKVDAQDPDTSPAEQSISQKLAQIDWYKVSGNEFSSNLGQKIGQRLAEGINQISLDNLLDLTRMGSSIQQKLLVTLGGVFAGGGLLAGNFNSLLSGLFTGVVEKLNWGQIGNTLKTRWRDVLIALGAGIGGAPVQIGKAIGDLLTQQIGTVPWSSIGSMLRSNLENALNSAASGVQKFSDTLARELGNAARGASAALSPIRPIIDSIRTAFDTAKNAVTTMASGVTTALGPLAGAIAPLLAAAQVPIDAFRKAAELALAAYEALPFTSGGGGGEGGGEGTPRQQTEAGFGRTQFNIPALNQGTEGTRVGGELVTALPNVGAGPQAALNQVRAIGQQITAAMTALANSVRSGAQQAIAALNPLGPAFTAMAARATAATTQMAAQVRAQFTQMQAGVMAVMTAMQAAVTASVTALTTQVRTQFTAMQTATAATMTAMQAQSAASWAALTAQGTASVNQLRAAVQSGMQAMASAGASAMAQFSSSVRSGFQQAVAAAQSGVAGIRGAVNSIGSLYGQGASIGASLGQGIAAGIQGQIGAVAAAAAALVSAAIGAAQSAGRISSPSKETMQNVGVPLAQGVIVGMESQRDAVARTFASMMPLDARLGRGYSPSVSAARYGGATGNVQNVTIITLEPGRWQEYLRKADRGDNAYRQMQPRSRETQLGLTRA